MAEEQRIAQEKSMAAMAQQQGYRMEASVSGVAVMAGPVANLSKDAHIEGIGVYESASSVHGIGKTRIAGSVNVIVRKSSAPVVLVLSSYEPINWRIVNQAGVQLKAVLLSGYNESSVVGMGDAKVVQLGRLYAYERGSSGFLNLQREVIKWTGKPFDSFQGKYKGSTFMIGGAY